PQPTGVRPGTAGVRGLDSRIFATPSRPRAPRSDPWTPVEHSFSLLNMRSTTSSSSGPRRPAATGAADLTTRARIRDAAIARFARDGFGASLRTIAADAGVSAGLVVHHFGSKDGLRAACDTYVFEAVRDAKTEAVSPENPDAGPMSLLAQLRSEEHTSELQSREKL